MTDNDTSLQSPLHDRHEALGAKFAAFGGWSMPLQYTGVVDEHTAVRERVGMFDVSHLGKTAVRGDGARAFLNACMTNDLGKIDAGQAQYTLCCDESGGVVDDLIVYLRSDDNLLLMPNAANAAEVNRRLRAAAPDGVDVIDDHREYAVLAIQGPNSDATLAAAGLPIEHGYMSFVDVDLDGVPVVVCRSGYTGERGYELIVPWQSAGAVWDAMMAAGQPHGITACGLGARDTLRTEMGYPLHGQDLSVSISPVQGGVGWAVGWSKPAFWGREALVAEKEAGPVRRLRAIKAAGRSIPRQHMTVNHDGEPVGEVTSGTFSPTLRTGIGLALLRSDLGIDAEVQVDVRGRPETFTVVKRPFVTPGTA